MKYSFIVPVYNAAKYLSDCLDSIRTQGCSDWECICVDDGSVDNSASVLDAYAAEDNRFRVLHKKNAGVSAARNDGLALATGEYVIFVDADDAVVPWMLADLNMAMSLNPDSDFYMFSAQQVVDLSVPLPEHNDVGKGVDSIVVDGDVAAIRACERVDGVLLAWGACHRRSSIADIRFKNYSNGEDALFGSECLCHARQITFLNAQLYRYRLPRAGSANNATLKNLKSCLDNANDYSKVMNDWCFASAVKGPRSRKSRNGLVGVTYPILLKIPTSDKPEGRRYFLESLRQRFVVGDDVFPFVDKLMVKVSCRLDCILIFHVFVYWPFVLRASLCKLPGFNGLKDTVRALVRRLKGLS